MIDRANDRVGMTRPRYLTKSRFALGVECSAKLFYTGKPEYPDAKGDDPFLESLAEGGYQVGQLAKHYFPGGHNIHTLDYEEAERQTLALMEEENVVLYEPAIRYGNLFIRIDILIKSENQLDLVEVKAKSFEGDPHEEFFTKKGAISSDYRSYIYDVAFQRHVLQQAFPHAFIRSWLMMADKSAKCPTDGLNQKFRIVRNPMNRKAVEVSTSLTPEDLTPRILIQVPVDDAVRQAYQETIVVGDQELPFKEAIEAMATHYEEDERIPGIVGSHCSHCEFTCQPDDGEHGHKSGFRECWSRALNWTDEDFDDATVLDIWNFRRKDRLIADEVIKLDDVHEEDISPRAQDELGLSTSERQWLQVRKYQDRDTSPYLDRDGMQSEMEGWRYPLHFIDFETTTAAIPFNRGRRPYEGIAFQYSHHVVEEDGSIAHVGEFLDATPGHFPNYGFVRALKQELEQDDGSIFMYASHENTFLNTIYWQLRDDPDPPAHAEELCAFIQSITRSTSLSVEQWAGDRCMVDMLDLVKRYYYDPYMEGSNSIKVVLPAILRSSQYLQNKYGQPVYGAEGGIPSHNFHDWQWIAIEGGEVVDPYHRLPKLFEDDHPPDVNLMTPDNELRDGGAALSAYGRMQFMEMSEYERDNLMKALLRYCELDTMAMVMIFEGWREMLGRVIQ